MNQSKSIVAAIDFSPCSADALCQAVRLAGWNNAAIHAIHILEAPALDPAPGALFPWPLPLEADLEVAARGHWERFAPACPNKAAIEFNVLWGNPRETILDHVAEKNASLLVLGAHSSHDFDRGIGTTAAACARRAKSKVLLVQPGHTGAYKHVAVCVDFSDTSRLALEQGFRVAAHDNAALHILHVYNDPWWGLKPPAEVLANMPNFQAQFRTGVEDRLRKFCGPLAHEVNALKPAFHAIQHEETWAGHGSGLIRFINAHQIDLAILGVRSKWNVRDTLMGSTAERVIRDATCSVLTVRPA